MEKDAIPVCNSKIKVLSVLPGSADRLTSLRMAIRQVEDLRTLGMENPIFYLGPRKSIARLFQRIYSLFQTVAREKPDLIHAHYGTITCFLASLIFWKKLVVTYRGSDLNPDRNVPLITRSVGYFLSQLVAFRATHIFCVSEVLANKLWSRRIKQKQISILPTGVHFSRFHPQDQAQCRQELNLPQDAFLIAYYSSSNRPLKQPEIAKAVVANIQNHFSKTHILEMKGDLNHTTIAKYLNAANCLILTSQQEGSPNIVKEALACHTPVVSFDVGDVKKWIERDRCSCVVPRNDVAAMTAHVLEILKSNPQKDRHIDLNELCAETTALKIATQYQNILAKSNREFFLLSDALERKTPETTGHSPAHRTL